MVIEHVIDFFCSTVRHTKLRSAKFFPNIWCFYPRFISVQCDLVNKMVVGQCNLNSLATVVINEEQRKNELMVFTFDDIFCDLKMKLFDSIEIRITDLENNTLQYLPQLYDKTLVELSLLKKIR